MGGTRVLSSESFEVGSTYEAIETCFERGWTDGLPVVPSTERAIGQFLEAARLEPGHVIGTIPERDRVILAKTVVDQVEAILLGRDS